MKNKKDILSDLKNETQSREVLNRGESSEEVEQVIVNPFTGESDVLFSKVLTRNKRAGETVASSLIIKKIERQYEW